MSTARGRLFHTLILAAGKARNAIGAVCANSSTAALAAPTKWASNLDAIINEGTLTIGRVGPALLGVLIAALVNLGSVTLPSNNMAGD